MSRPIATTSRRPTFLRGLTLGAILGAIIAGSSIWSRRFRRNVDGGSR